MKNTRERLIQATLTEIEIVGLRATTKDIAARAGLNELTLFRHYKTKQQLIIAAVRQTLGSAASTTFEPSGELEFDLAQLAKEYVQLADAHPVVITHILGEADGQLVSSLVLPLQQQIANRAQTLMRFYVKQNSLNDKVPIEDLIREFMGPLMARAFLHKTLPRATFDAPAYVQRFLYGHARLEINQQY